MSESSLYTTSNASTSATPPMLSPYGYIEETWRVGLKDLQDLPLETCISTRVRDMFDSKTRDLIEQSAKDSIPGLYEILYCRRYRLGDDPNPKQDTILVVVNYGIKSGVRFDPGPHALTSSTPTWRECIENLQRLVQQASASVMIEVISRELFTPRYSVSVPNPNSAIAKAWGNGLEREALRCLKNTPHELASHLQAMLVLDMGLGPDEELEQNTWSSVILISLKQDIGIYEEHWIPAKTAIENLVGAGNRWGITNVKVEFQRRDIEPSSTIPELVPWKGSTEAKDRYEWSELVNTGSPIAGTYKLSVPGRLTDAQEIGTLGLYLTAEMIFTDNTHLTRTFGLTNYHVVRNAIQGFGIKGVEARETSVGKEKRYVYKYLKQERGSPLEHLDAAPLFPTKRKRMEIQSPPTNFIQHKIVELEEWLESARANNIQGLVRQLEEDTHEWKTRLDANGHQFACLYLTSGSGLLASGSRANYALLETIADPSRYGLNISPHGKPYTMSVDDQAAMVDDTMKAAGENQYTVSMKGAISGFTTGRVSCLRAVTAPPRNPDMSVDNPSEELPGTDIDMWKDVKRLVYELRAGRTDYVREWYIASGSEPIHAFAQPGDSGSSIWRGLTPIGLLWGGLEIEKGKAFAGSRISFASDLKDVISDIERLLLICPPQEGTTRKIAKVKIRPASSLPFHAEFPREHK